MDRRDDLKSWLADAGSLYGAVVLFVTMGFLLIQLDILSGTQLTTHPPSATEAQVTGQYGDFPR